MYAPRRQKLADVPFRYVLREEFTDPNRISICVYHTVRDSPSVNGEKALSSRTAMLILASPPEYKRDAPLTVFNNSGQVFAAQSNLELTFEFGPSAVNIHTANITFGLGVRSAWSIKAIH